MERALLTTNEVAEELGVTAARVRQMVLSGLLPSEKAGRDVLIPIAAVDMARQRKTKPGPKPKDEATAEPVLATAEALTPKVKAKTGKAKKAGAKKAKAF